MLMRSDQVKGLRALGRGRAFNEPFRQKVEDLEKALTALQARADFLRDGHITDTRRTVDNVRIDVYDIRRKSTILVDRSERAQSQLGHIQEVTRDLKFTTEHNERQLHSLGGTFKDRMNDLKDSQEKTKDRIDILGDIQSLREEINRTLRLTLETVECE
jgi:chromosome segregation ATPase